MAMQTAAESRTHNDYTVGWVCALPKEQTAATAMLDEIHPDLPKPQNDPNTYTLGSIGKHNIVVCCLPKGKIGNNSAATFANQMARTFPSIKVGLMVGIGGGIPPKVRLGDVVVSVPADQYQGVVQWDFGKTEKGGKFRRTGALDSPPKALLTALTKMETRSALNGSKIPQYLRDMEKKWPNLVPEYTRSVSLKDPLFTTAGSHSNWAGWQAMFSMVWGAILTLLGFLLGRGAFARTEHGTDGVANSTTVNTEVEAERKSAGMRVHYGLIASGNQVIKDAGFRDRLNESLGGNVLCVEMEAAGLMDNFPCIVIRGICDYADSQKNKDWQEHAAAVAAACAKELLEYVQPIDVDRECPIKDLMYQVLDNTTTVRSKLDKKEDLEILDWLTQIDYGPRHSDFLRRRQPATGQWLLDSVEYRNWLKTKKQTMHCPGIPGAGKTILTSVVVHDLCNEFHNDTTVGIAYVYCEFRRQHEQKAEDLLTSLLKQLSRGQSSLPDSVRALYDQHRNNRTRPLFHEILNTLRSVSAMYSRVFIVVDALDECQLSECGPFVSGVLDLQAVCGANIFVTSRFVPKITENFKGSISLEIRASEEDVQKYLDGHMFRLPEFVRRSSESQDEIKTMIVQSVQGMFLLAQLHLDSLVGKISPKALRTALEKLPTGSDAYTHAYEEAMSRIEGQCLDHKELAKRVLSWIACAKRPMTALELQHALAVEIGKSELDQENFSVVQDIVSVCAGLVTVDENSGIIRLVHYTTQQYFEQTQGKWFPKAETDIAKVCVTYLSFDIFGSGFCQTDEEFEERLRSNKFYDYAAHNWGHHARESSMSFQGVTGLLDDAAKAEASSQALMVTRWTFSQSGYSQRFPRQMTGLHLAAYFGVSEAVNGLLKEDNVDSKDGYGRTPLSHAAQEGYEAVVQLLLEKKADINSEDIVGQTPLILAARRGHNAVLGLLLAKDGIDVNPKGNNTQTLLSWAVSLGQEVTAKFLLPKDGVDVNSKNNTGQTLLHYAVLRGQEAMVKFLLANDGGDVHSKTNYGQTPLHCAVIHGLEAVVGLLLAKDGIDVNSKDFFRQTPLHYAVLRGQEAMVKLLLVKDGVDVNSKDVFGQTPLSLASNSGHLGISRLLEQTLFESVDLLEGFTAESADDDKE